MNVEYKFEHSQKEMNVKLHLNITVINNEN